MSPDVAPEGIGKVTLVFDQVEGTAGVPLKATAPGALPKLVPVTVTIPPMGAVAGETAVIAGITRKDCALLATPETVTITSEKPGSRVLGTGATILVSLQELGAAVTPPTVTVSGEAPKPVPVMVIGDPTGLTWPSVGEMLLMFG
jgi:hypothetical protein